MTNTTTNHSILADLAETFYPDTPEAKNFFDTLVSLSEGPDIEDGVEISEIADGAVPIYTHELFTIFVDLGAYQEDISELASENFNFEANARIALYLIAERLLLALEEEKVS